ncbi:MAG: DUF4445 domain-containing protein [Deltaproteobacteria bacterium]|nr:DUF4445 domain-containing protein [Deltaproteobacteria bacterium]
MTRTVGNKDNRGIGVAFDIGTTTVVGSSVDFSTGKVLSTLSAANPQVVRGRDVIARINAIVQSPALLDEMRAAVIGACNGIMKGLTLPGPVTEITAAGNPVMESILLGISPEPLSRVPYKPAFTGAQRVAAAMLGFEVPSGVTLYAFPLIGGFVGGDAVAVALSLGIGKASSPTLAIDIGTNSEILLAARGNIYAASAAAGPAFEGGELKYGMTAQSGAIQGVKIEGDSLALDVIGAVAPRGICGSGLIEAASALIKAAVIDRSGRIKGRDEVPNNLSARIREEAGGNSFILYRGAGGEVLLDQSDIRALQTAKSATRAGILMLLKKGSTTAADVGKVYIAGAFGSRLEKEGLKTIGLLDEGWLDGVSSVGDAALTGAVEALRDEKKLEAEELAGRIRYVSLSGSSHFEKEFIKNMNF